MAQDKARYNQQSRVRVPGCPTRLPSESRCCGNGCGNWHGKLLKLELLKLETVKLELLKLETVKLAMIQARSYLEVHLLANSDLNDRAHDLPARNLPNWVRLDRLVIITVYFDAWLKLVW